jgi:lambda family phage tail tape measure protein
VDAAIAGSIAGMRLDLDARSSAAITGGADPLEVRAERAIGRSSIDSLEQSELERKAIEEANRERGRSGGGKSEDQPDFVEALRAEMVVREQLVKLYGDEYELQSEIARIVEGLGKDSGDYNAQAIEALAQQNILLKEQEVLRDEAAAQMESIYQMLGNEIGAFTTAMISDTKSVEEAFKSMAKNIIDQLIQIFIVEQLVNSISGGMGSFFGGGGGSSKKALSLSANGNVFSGGSQVQAYANGGVVNGPTMFPMNGNKTGLMGEAGPEAIMPLKRGANGKLGVQAEGSGGDNVVIHQNFNFQANGDDSVKKLIQQAAPQIAQMTKSSMLNDRRRGGQTKAVFG